MLLLSQGGDSLTQTVDKVAPLVVPTGELPPASAISEGQAALRVVGAQTEQKNVLGIVDAKEGDGMKNLLFLGVVGFLLWKYGRKVLSA